MLTKIYKISKIIITLVFVLGFTLTIIAGVYWWKRNKNRKGLSASEIFFNADTSDLTDEELQELNDKKDVIIWFDLIWFVNMVINNLNV